MNKSIINKFLSGLHYQNREKERVEFLFANRLKNKKILDVGCGTGKYLEIFKKYGCQATGMDLNPHQVQDLRGKGYDVYTPIELPKDEKWDVIFMSHVIEHMTPDTLISTFESLFPRLENNGLLVIITPLLGARFYYDFSHIRPYYPQSLWMLFGDLKCPASYKSGWRLALDDIYFFRDPWRLRECRNYYPCVAKYESSWKFSFFSNAVTLANVMLAFGYKLLPDLLGTPASWLGIYKLCEN